MKDDKVYIQQILIAVRKIESFTAGTDRPTLGADEKRKARLLCNLCLSEKFQKKISTKNQNFNRPAMERHCSDSETKPSMIILKWI